MNDTAIADERVCLLSEHRRQHDLAQTDGVHGDSGDAIDRIVGRAQALSRRLVAGKTGVSVEDFLAERARAIM